MDFAKSDKDNIDKGDLAYLKKMAKALLALSDKQIQALIDKQELTEVK